MAPTSLGMSVRQVAQSLLALSGARVQAGFWQVRATVQAWLMTVALGEGDTT